MSRRLALLLFAFIVLVWGANWPILKLGLQDIPPLWLAAARLVLGAAVLAAILLASKEGLRPPPRQDWPIVVSVGLLQMAGFTAFMNLGLQHVDAGRSAILAYTTPLWVTPGAMLFLGERMTLPRILGVVLGLAGVAVLFNPLDFDWNDGPALWGSALLLLAAFVWAGAILHVRGHSWASSSLALAPWQMLVGAVPVIALAALFEGAPRIDWNPFSVFVILYNAVLATALAFWAVLAVTRMLPAVVSSLSFLGVPFAGLLLSAWWLGEPLTTAKLAAMALVLTGVAAVTLGGKSAKNGP